MDKALTAQRLAAKDNCQQEGQFFPVHFWA